MYIPSHNQATDPAAIVGLIHANPFATLVSTGADGSLSANSYPLLWIPDPSTPLDPAGQRPSGKIEGHLSRHNLQCEHLRDGAEVLAIFHGPHTYVSPTWYAFDDVPTWNYASVQIRGRIRLVEEPRALIALLRRLSDRFESRREAPWRFQLPEDLRNPEDLRSAILGFEIDPTRIDAKLKLSQNRSLEDRRGVIEGLGRERNDDGSREVARMMGETLNR